MQKKLLFDAEKTEMKYVCKVGQKSNGTVDLSSYDTEPISKHFNKNKELNRFLSSCNVFFYFFIL